MSPRGGEKEINLSLETEVYAVLTYGTWLVHLKLALSLEKFCLSSKERLKKKHTKSEVKKNKTKMKPSFEITLPVHYKTR